MAQWTRVATNRFDAGGNFTFTNNVHTDGSQIYYRLQLQ